MKYTEKKYNFPDYVINTTTWGKGEPLFLIPGWPFSSKIYLFLEPYLSKKYRVTSVDLPDWAGKSFFKNNSQNYKVQNYLKIVENSFNTIYPKNKTLSIGGVSIGGTMALLLAKNLERRINNILTISSPHEGLTIRKIHRMETTLMDFAYKVPQLGYFLMAAYAIGKIDVARKNRSILGKGLFKEQMNDFVKLKPKPVLEFAIDFFNSDYTQKIGNISNKVVVIGCKKDGAVPVEMTRKLAKKILSNTDYYELENGTHASIIEYPEKISKYILGSFN